MRRLAAYDLYSPDAAASAHLSRLVFLQDTIEGRRVLYINPPCNDAVLFLLDAGATNVTVVTDDNAALLSLAQACNQHERADVVRGLVASVPELASRLAGQHIFDVIFDADMPARVSQQASRDDVAVQILALRSLLSPEGFVISALPTGALGLEQAFHDEAMTAPVSYQALADVLTQTFPAVEVYWQSLVLGYAFGGTTQNDQQDGLSPNPALLQDGAEPAGFYVFAFGNVAPVAEDVSFIQLSGADLWATLRKVWQSKLQRALAGQHDAEQYRAQYEQMRVDLEKVASQFNRLVRERESWQEKIDEIQHALVSERSAKSALAGRLAAMESSLVEQDQTQELQAALDEARHLLQQHQMRTKNALAKVAEQGQALSQTNEVVEQLKAQCMMLQQALQHANDERARAEHAHRALQIAIHNQADELDLALRNEESEHRQQIEQLSDGHRQELERLQREHQQQLDELRQQLNARDVRLEDTAQGALLAEQEEHAVELQRERALVEQLVHAAKLAQAELDSQHNEILSLRAQLHTAQAAQTHVSSLVAGMTAMQIEQERLQNLVAAYEQQYEQQVAAKNAEQSLVGEITQSLQGMASLLQGRFAQHAHELQQAQQETAALRAHVSSLVAGMSAQNADNIRLQNLVAAYEQQLAAQTEEHNLVGEITQSLQGMAALLQGRFAQHAQELQQSQQETAALRAHVSSMAAGMAAQNADILRLQNLVSAYEQQLAAQTEEHNLVGEITQSLQGMAALLRGRFAQHAEELQQSQQETAAARAHISSLVAGLSAQSNDNARLHDLVAAYEQQLAAQTEEHNLVGEITQSLQGMAALLQGRFAQHAQELQSAQQETSALRAHVSSLVAGMTAIQAQSNEWQRRAYTLQIENDMLQSNRGAELALMREVGDAASIIQSEMNRREQALSASRAQISSMAAGMSALTSQVWQSRREEWMRWNNIVADAQVTVSESQARAELLEGNCVLLEQELEQAKQEAAQLQAHVSTLLAEQTALSQNLQQVSSQAEQQTARADLFAAQLDEAQQQHAQHIEKLHAEHAAQQAQQAAPVVAPPEPATVPAAAPVSVVDMGATVRYTVEQVEAMRQEMRREMHREMPAVDPLASEMPAPSAPLPSPEVQQKQFAELDDAVLSMAALVTV